MKESGKEVGEAVRDEAEREAWRVVRGGKHFWETHGAGR